MTGEEIITKNVEETKKAARHLAEEIGKIKSKSAIVLALDGDLGAGKTTFTQGFAEAFGVKENVLSPTFVLMKIYAISPKNRFTKKHLIHIDCYRINSAEDLLHLGFNNFLKDKDAIIVIEWADKIKKILPNNAIYITFGEAKEKNHRIITIAHRLKNEKIYFN